MNRDRDLPSILDYRERKVYRRKSRRRIRKIFFDDFSSIQGFSSVCQERFTSFKSMSESINQSLNSRDSKESKDEIKIEREFKSESLSRRIVSGQNLNSKQIFSAKQTLGRLVRTLLDKDLNSYVESYKYMNKCSCVFKTS